NLYDYDVKAFFESPIRQAPTSAHMYLDKEQPSWIGIDKLKGELGRRLSSDVKLIHELVEQTKVAFNAIKYNAPLAIFHDEVVKFEHDPKEGLEALKRVLEAFENEGRVKLDDKIVRSERLRVDKSEVVGVLLSLALASSLDGFKKGLPSEVTTNYLENQFTKMYERLGLGLNRKFLSWDLKEVKKEGEKLSDGEERLYQELAGFKGSSDIKRNFFAHSGLLREGVIVRKEGDVVILKYDDKWLEEIKKWLKSPE
ncbi:MAG: TM1812 family CRISPR-associated protein, partial [Candidatus Heimdallarchaeota archaeon]